MAKPLLVEAYVQASRSDERQAIEWQLSSVVQSRLKSRFNVTPLVDVTVLMLQVHDGCRPLAGGSRSA